MLRVCLVGCLLSVLAIAAPVARAEEKAEKAPLRAGIIGLDTSHVIAFTDLFNAEKPMPGIEGVRIVAAYPGGSDDIKSSYERVPEYTKKLKDKGVEIVDSIPALLEKVDVVLVESVDGRKHLEQVKPVFESGKLVYLDKPLAGSLADGIAIAELGKKHNVAWFSSSSLRYSAGIAGMKTNAKVGEIIGCDAWSPCPIEPTHPDLFWYGIHGVETLYTIMGPGCVSVTRTTSPDSDVVVGLWKDGRIGTFRGIRKGKHDYGAMAFGAKSNAPAGGYGGYAPLVVEIAKFFKTGKAPIAPEETLEILAFMEAADESKRQGGKPVTLESVMEKAKSAGSK